MNETNTVTNLTDDEREHRLRDLELIRRLRLLDDIFMKVVLEDNIPGVQDIVRVVLRRPDITVVEVHTQRELSNLVGHGVRLDVLAMDEAGRYYNIEIQIAESGAAEKRARYNLSEVDCHTFPPGAKYKDLAETWVIFITETDLWGHGLPVYTVNRFFEETGERFEDKGHIVYVNGAYEGEDDIGLLMADFRERDPEKLHFSSLGDKARYYKNPKGEVTSMSRVVEEWKAAVRAEAWEEAWEEAWAKSQAKTQAEERNHMIDALVRNNSKESLLHDKAFSGLHITESEIDAARMRLAI